MQRSKKTTLNVQFLSIYDSFAISKCNQSYQSTFQNGIQCHSISIIFRAMKWSKTVQFPSFSEHWNNPIVSNNDPKRHPKTFNFYQFMILLRSVNVTNRFKKHSKNGIQNVQFLSFSEHWNDPIVGSNDPKRYSETFNFYEFMILLRSVNVTNRFKQRSKKISNVVQFLSFSEH